MLNKLQLALSQTARLLFGERRSTLFQHFEGRRGIFDIVARRMSNRGAQQIVIGLSLLQLVQNYLLKFE